MIDYVSLCYISHVSCHQKIREWQREILSPNKMKTKVVKLCRRNGKIVQGCDVYIGKKINKGGWIFSESLFHNPYIVGKTLLVKNNILVPVSTKEESVIEYWNMLISGESEIYNLEKIQQIRNAIYSLKGKTLGCWCKHHEHDLCHGDVLAFLADAWDGSYSGKRIKIKGGINWELMSLSLRELLNLYY